MLVRLILSSLISLAFCSSTPEWQDLNCEEGHKYLFSEVQMTWEEARGECQLYGGWLVDLRTRKEQNCLLRYAQAAGVPEGWYWHDGNFTFTLQSGLNWTLYFYFPYLRVILVIF